MWYVRTRTECDPSFSAVDHRLEDIADDRVGTQLSASQAIGAAVITITISNTSTTTIFCPPFPDANANSTC